MKERFVEKYREIIADKLDSGMNARDIAQSLLDDFEDLHGTSAYLANHVRHYKRIWGGKVSCSHWGQFPQWLKS